MSVNEQELLQSGFTATEIQKLKKYVVNNEIILGKVIDDLSRRFQAAVLLTSGMLICYIAALVFASKENIISLGVAIIIVLILTWLFQPPVLAYKAWVFRKKKSII